MSIEWELSSILPSVKMAYLMRHRGWHRQCRIWIRYTGTWIYVPTEVDPAYIFVVLGLDNKACMAVLIVLKRHIGIQANESACNTTDLPRRQFDGRTASKQRLLCASSHELLPTVAVSVFKIAPQGTTGSSPRPPSV
jgi:hypothetical protein